MSNTAEGMRGYKPRRPGTTLDDVVTPEIRAKRASMIEEAKDENRKKAAGDAYDKAMPNPYKKGGSVDKSQDKAMIKKAFKQHDAQEHKGGKGTSLKLAKGGKARRFAEGGLTADEQEAADKAAGLEASNKEPSAGFFARLKAGNIDEPGSEAYEKYGAGRGKALRMASAPVTQSASVKMEKTPEVASPTVVEDERPAPTNMSAATVFAPAKAAPAKPVKNAQVAAIAKPVTKPAAKPAAKPASTTNPVINPDDELEAYAKAKKSEKAAAKAAAAKKAFTPPSAEDINKGMEAAATMLGGGASLKAIQALAKKLASRSKAVTLNKIPRVTMQGSNTPQIGNTPTQSTAPYLKEIGNSQPKIGMKKGGSTSHMSSASRRGDGIATKGKTRGKMV